MNEILGHGKSEKKREVLNSKTNQVKIEIEVKKIKRGKKNGEIGLKNASLLVIN